MIRLLCKPLIVLMKTVRDVIGPIIEHGVTIPLLGSYKLSISMDVLVLLIVSLETAIIIYRQDPNISQTDRGLSFIIHRVLQWILIGEYGLRLISRGVWFSDTGILKTVWGWIDTIAISSMVADTQTPFLNLIFIRLLYFFKLFAFGNSASGTFPFVDSKSVVAKLVSSQFAEVVPIVHSFHSCLESKCCPHPSFPLSTVLYM
jgi:hypothetical protein